MERYTQKSTLTDYVIGAGALAVTLLPGCGAKEDKIAPDPIAQHSLDMKVANAETINGADVKGGELDLSTPEKAWEAYEQMCRKDRWEDTNNVWANDAAMQVRNVIMKEWVKDFNSKYGNSWDLRTKWKKDIGDSVVILGINLYADGKEMFDDEEGVKARQVNNRH